MLSSGFQLHYIPEPKAFKLNVYKEGNFFTWEEAWGLTSSSFATDVKFRHSGEELRSFTPSTSCKTAR